MFSGFHNVAESKYGTQLWNCLWSQRNTDGELTASLVLSCLHLYMLIHLILVGARFEAHSDWNQASRSRQRRLEGAASRWGASAPVPLFEPPQPISLDPQHYLERYSDRPQGVASDF